MSNWLERVELEERELAQKIEKLEIFLNADVSQMPICALALLKAQRVWMKNYQEVLQARIALGKGGD